MTVIGWHARTWVVTQPTPPPGNDGTGISADQVLTLIIAGLALLVAFAGTWLSNERAKASEKTAREALEDARLARREGTELALWTGALEAVMRMLGFDPTREPVGTRLQDLRVRFTLLVDHFESWEGFDEWLAEEHALGTALGRQILEQANPTDSVEQQVERLGGLAAWGGALGSNLRLLRRHGYQPEKVHYLRDHAREVRASIYKRNNWGPCPRASRESRSWTTPCGRSPDLPGSQYLLP